MMFYLLFTILLIYLFIIFKRADRYKYNTSKDYLYNLHSQLEEKLKFQNNFLTLPSNHKEFDTLFLKINIKSNLNSYFLKPFVKYDGIRHYFEYGARGVRYINLSNIKTNKLSFVFKNVQLADDDLILYGYNNNIDLSKKILILAPHADDAEIAAFGLYKSAKNVTIVTTTIGEHGACNYCEIYDGDREKASVKKAELRVVDALSSGLLGGVDIKNSLTLGYFGGSIKWMMENPKEKASSLRQSIKDMNRFRKVLHSDIKLDSKVEPTYNSFLTDLESIIESIKPQYIITPHPTIDIHPDHKYTTLTLIDALKNTKHSSKILTYTNHLSLSETYPIGDINSSVTLPPNFKEFFFDSIYSFELDSELQIDKFFALESMHDLRDSTIQISVKRAFKQLNKMIKRKITGKDKSYYKRAIRANELFFVVNSENIDELIDI